MNKSSLRSDETGDTPPHTNPASPDSSSIDGDGLSLPELCARVHTRVERFLDKEPETERLRGTQAQTRISLGVIEEALERYSLDSLSLSYNGGKDCLVLLILYLTALHKKYNLEGKAATHPDGSDPSPIQLPRSLNSVYIVPPDPFPEVDAFVAKSADWYHLEVARYPTPMRDAFSAYLAANTRVEAIFVGTRRTDPHGASLTHFDRTDRGWPDFMRIHPVIDWHYAEVWAFTMAMGVTYCGLYDEGYTSLGGVGDTWRNPRLREDSGGGEDGKGEKYRPAWMLEEDGEERLGRDR